MHLSASLGGFLKAELPVERCLHFQPVAADSCPLWKVVPIRLPSEQVPAHCPHLLSATDKKRCRCFSAFVFLRAVPMPEAEPREPTLWGQRLYQKQSSQSLNSNSNQPGGKEDQDPGLLQHGN